MAETEKSWTELSLHKERLSSLSLRQLFLNDLDRFERMSESFEDLTIDYSKECVDPECFSALLDLARSAGVEDRRDDMFEGKQINFTENRSVLHMALRAPADGGFREDGEEIGPLVADTLDRMCLFADDVRNGTIKTSSGGRFTDVINIGIGGSDLGPAMVTRALSPYRGNGPKVHFVSNVDGAHLSDTLALLDPVSTLIVVASKTFTTQETLANARAAKNWLENSLGESGADQHLAALSTNLEGTKTFGIDPARVFGFWDWVGGRYSVWSAIGLSVALSIGSEHFRSFLTGAQKMDTHFATAPLEKNLPVILALVGIWRRNIQNLPTVALIPYDQRLERFPAYVQQLDMESNGKHVGLDGSTVEQQTGPVIWGEPGTNAQHSFFQLIHQGTDVIPVDFIIAAQSGSRFEDQHALLQANCLAQSEALAFGKTRQEVEEEMRQDGFSEDEIERLAAHRTFQGNRPSTTIVHRQLDPYSLGRLIALFEHKVFVQGTIWGVNSYDQWGVELGKKLTKTLVPMVRGEESHESKDSSTRGLLERLKELDRSRSV